MPITWITILLIWAFFSDKKRKKLLGWAIIIFIFFSLPIISIFFMNKWEKSPIPIKNVKNYDMAIVLCGMLKIKQKPYDRVYSNNAIDRVLHTVQLYKLGKVKKIIITGGDNAIIGENRSEALEAIRLFKLCGVPEKDLITETTSRNTYENAVNTCKIIKEKYSTSSFLLVTSAFHMRRAIGCFRKQGLIFDNFPTDFRGQFTSLKPNMFFIPDSKAINLWHLLTHELLGYTVYLATGKSAWYLPKKTFGRLPSTAIESNVKTINSTVLTDSVFTGGIEGPAVDCSNNLYVVNFQKQGTIGKVNTKIGKTELFVELPNESIGNGIRFNKKGDFFIADYINHNILKIDSGTTNISVYAHDTSLNQPNDLAIMDNGILFASDPNWDKGTGNLWRVDTTGKFMLLEKNMGTTNGVEVSPNNQRLYVNESIQRKIWVYDLNEKGEISNKQLFHEFDDGGMDGMRCDIEGNLYITRYDKGEIAILSPQGKLIQQVKLQGQKPTNIAFGGKEGKTCFVTMQAKKWIETFEADFKGRSQR